MNSNQKKITENTFPLFNISEFFQIKKQIEECDVFYAAIYGLADISYSNDISTACIEFDKEGNSLHMKINFDFWQKLNNDAKIFVILHELYHVIFDHSKKFKALGLDFSIANIASDIVINHHIDKKYLSRNLFDWKPYCWVETCFPNEKNMPTDQTTEFYYAQLLKNPNFKNQNQQLLGSHSDENSPEQNDENSQSKNEKIEDDFSPKYFSDTFKEILKQNPTLYEDIQTNPDFKNLGKTIEEHIPPIAPKSSSKSGTKADYIPLDEKPNFETLMKILKPKKNLKTEKSIETWVGTHRRYTAFLEQSKNIMLPNILDIEHNSQDKKQVWVFMDSSGSCHGMFYAFSHIVKSLLKEKKLICRAFAFGDDCEEIQPTSSISFYSGNAGGFDCIEEKILSLMKKENISYPDNIVVLSDGGVQFQLKNKLKNPKNWILLHNNNYTKHLTPPGGKYFYLDSNFFKLDSKKTMKM